MPNPYTGSSIVDYLGSIGKPSDFSSRTSLAGQYGIQNYTGTVKQNLSLLGKLRGSSTAVQQPPAYNPYQGGNPMLSNQGYSYTPSSISANPSVITATPAVNAVQNMNQMANTPPAQGNQPLNANSSNPTMQDIINQINKIQTTIGNLSPEQKASLGNINNLSNQETTATAKLNTLLQDNQYQKAQTQAEELRKTRQDKEQAILDYYNTQFKPLQDKYLASLNPATQETDLQTQLSNIQDQIRSTQTAVEQQKEAQYGGGRPVSFSDVLSNAVDRNTYYARKQLQDTETSLLNRLGLAQKAREATTTATKEGISLLQSDTNLQLQVQEKLRQNEEDIINRAKDLDTQQRQNFADILSAMKGTNPDTLSPQVQAQLAQLAAQRNIPFDLLLGGLKHTYNIDQAELLTKQAGLEKTQAETMKLRREAKGMTETTSIGGINVPLDVAPYYNTSTSGVGYVDLSTVQGTAAQKKSVVDQAQKAGIKIITNKNTAADLVNIGDANGKLDTIGTIMSGIDQPSFLSRDLYGLGLTKLSVMAQTNPQQAAAGALSSIGLDILKAISGVQGFRGNQSAIQQVTNHLPSIYDTNDTVKQKISFIRQLISDRENAIIGKTSSKSNDPLGIR